MCKRELIALFAATATAASLRLEPARIHLAGKGASQHYVVTLRSDTGADEDVTTKATVRATDPSIVEVRQGTISGLTPGTTGVEATLGELRATTPVQVGSGSSSLAVRFSPDIVTILTIKGCNSSNCHGAIAGKNGFKLSLFGYDPAADHAMIGKRVDKARPADSMVLRKPSFQIAHGGGRVLPTDSHDYATFLEWIRQGAALDSSGPTVQRLEVVPTEVALAASSTARSLAVIARMSDGTTRDMTREVRYETSNDAVVKLGDAGQYRAVSPGIGTVLARAMGKAATAQIGVAAPDAGAFSVPGENNFIDGLVFAKLRRMNVAPAALSNDQQFLRRVYVDTLGRIPTPAERRRFLAHGSRSRLIDELLEHKEYVSYRTLRMEEWYRNTQLFSQGKPAGSFRYWVMDQVAVDRPYDAVVRDLLTSLGDTVRSPASGFWLPATDFMLNKFDVKQMTPSVTRTFLGLRMECAECHNHPLENFTQDDFYGLAAFFGQMRIKIGQGVYRRTWYLDESGEVEHPVTKRAVSPKVLGGGPLAIPPERDRREALAAWLTAPSNPYFARATVNRVWHAYFGTGIVEPFDDMRSTNAPTNRELLDRLADSFVASGFRMRELDRLIFNSATYQLSSRPGRSDQNQELEGLLFARYVPRRLPAEAMLDSISQVTEKHHRFGGHPPGTLAKDLEVGDRPPYILEVFGFPARDLLATRHEEPTLAQALHLMNRETLKDKLEPEDSVLGRLLPDEASDDAVVAELYERLYARLPEADESTMMRRYMKREADAGRTRRRAFENMLLVLLNSKEFQLNH